MPAFTKRFHILCSRNHQTRRQHPYPQHKSYRRKEAVGGNRDLTTIAVQKPWRCQILCCYSHETRMQHPYLRGECDSPRVGVSVASSRRAAVTVEAIMVQSSVRCRRAVMSIRSQRNTTDKLQSAVTRQRFLQPVVILSFHLIVTDYWPLVGRCSLWHQSWKNSLSGSHLRATLGRGGAKGGKDMEWSKTVKFGGRVMESCCDSQKLYNTCSRSSTHTNTVDEPLFGSFFARFRCCVD